MRPSIARVSEQLDPRFAASRHTTAPINHALRLYPVARKLCMYNIVNISIMAGFYASCKFVADSLSIYQVGRTPAYKGPVCRGGGGDSLFLVSY